MKDILIYLTFIVGLFVFIGCEKEEFSLNSNENNAIDIHVSSNNATNICVPGYSSNAFDSIGILHNYWVGYIESLCYPDDSIQRVIYVTDSVLLGEFGQSFSSCLWDLDDIEDFKDEFETDSLTSYFNGLNISSLEKSHILDFRDILITYDGTNVCDIIDDIKDYEDDIMSSYSSSQIVYSLIGATIARHSIYYWDQSANSINSGYNLEVRANWKWLKYTLMGLADVAGGIGGGLAGSTFGPWGTFAGSVTGGVSASNGMAKLWDAFGGEKSS
jgi:hypothetical protein